MSIDASTAMIEITTRSSIRLKAFAAGERQERWRRRNMPENGGLGAFVTSDLIPIIYWYPYGNL